MNIIKFLKVRKMIKEIDKTIKVRYSKVLECEPENAKIYVGFKNNDLENKSFQDYVNELQPNCKYSVLLLGILHEIGHIYTLGEDDETEYLQDTELLNQLHSKGLISDEQKQHFYLRLPMESHATQWALAFANDNPNFCNKWNKILM